MSLQPIRQSSSQKKLFPSNLSSHSKNKTINSLINKKLSEEKQHVKERFVKLIRNSETQNEGLSFMTPKKRSQSVESLGLSRSQIRNSLNFNPLQPTVDFGSQFVISRQRNSALIGKDSLERVAHVRQNDNTLQIKLNFQEKGVYADLPLSATEGQNKSTFQETLKANLGEQLWLPSNMHAGAVLESLEEADRSLHSLSDVNADLFVKSSTFEHSINKLIDTPLKNHEQIQKKGGESVFLSYNFKKYHKEDYASLEKWFEANVVATHKTNAQSPSNRTLLNQLYCVHIAGFQEFIRLTYVESWKKALLLEKLLWSFTRLFLALIEEQHKINFEEFKRFSQELRQTRSLHEDRCTRLEKAMLQAQREVMDTQKVVRRLSLAYVTYSRVNRFLSVELELTHRSLKKSEQEASFINMRLIKLIEYLSELGMVKVTQNEVETTYFFFHNGRCENLLTVPTSLEAKRAIQKQLFEEELNNKIKHKSQALTPKDHKTLSQLILDQRASIESEKQQPPPSIDGSIGQTVGQMENELNKYWETRENSLDLKGVINRELMAVSSIDVGVSTAEKFEAFDFSAQFPQIEEKPFAEFLSEQLQAEREQYQKEKAEQNELYISLKDLYEESYQKIKQLTKQNKELKLQLQTKNRSIRLKEGKEEQLLKNIDVLNVQLETKSREIETMIKEITEKESEKQREVEEKNESERKWKREYQNCQNLIRNNLQLKEKLEISDFKLRETDAKFESLSQQNTANLQLIRNLKEEVDVKAHSLTSLQEKLNACAPTINKFLEFKRYDKDSIIVASVKREIEKHLADFVDVRDSDLFLTK